MYCKYKYVVIYNTVVKSEGPLKLYDQLQKWSFAGRKTLRKILWYILLTFFYSDWQNSIWDLIQHWKSEKAQFCQNRFQASQFLMSVLKPTCKNSIKMVSANVFYLSGTKVPRVSKVPRVMRNNDNKSFIYSGTLSQLKLFSPKGPDRITN